MRLFVAINLPPELRQDIWNAAGPLREAAGSRVRWVPPDALHLTLKFLGTVDQGRVPDLAGAVDAAARGAKPFSLPLDGFGAFPSPRRPQIVWLGCEAVPALELLQHHVERSMQPLGFPVDGRPFRPHLTIGRVRRDERVPRGLATQIERLRYANETTVAQVDLMESHLHQSGARYVVRHRVPLTG